MKQFLLCMASATLFLTASAFASNGKTPAKPKAKSKVSAPAAKKGPCTGEGYKLINGVCQAGTQVWTRSEWDSTYHYYRCYYYYSWSDGSTSQEYFIISYPGCIA